MINHATLGTLCHLLGHLQRQCSLLGVQLMACTGPAQWCTWRPLPQLVLPPGMSLPSCPHCLLWHFCFIFTQKSSNKVSLAVPPKMLALPLVFYFSSHSLPYFFLLSTYPESNRLCMSYLFCLWSPPVRKAGIFVCFLALPLPSPQRLEQGLLHVQTHYLLSELNG